MASTLFIKFLSYFYERFSMHTSVFKLVWVSLACIQVKFPYLHHKARVLIIYAQGFFYWSLHFGFIWLHKGFVSILYLLILIWVFISIVSPFLLSYLNSKVNEWCKLCLIIMICKFTMMCYASLSCYVCKFAMLWYASCHVMLCKFAMLWYASCHVMYASLGWSFCSCYHVMQAYLGFMSLKLQALC